MENLGIGPNFLKGCEQFAIKETVKNQQLENERIHVVRITQRFKCYHMFDRIVPVNMLESFNQIKSVCALLSNFQKPTLKKT